MNSEKTLLLPSLSFDIGNSRRFKRTRLIARYLMSNDEM